LLSARKLKRGASNLLAGRAFVHHLHPLTHLELGTAFRLKDALRWGTLPRLYHLSNNEEKAEFLSAYAFTYLKEEIATEQIVRKLAPFRNFLEIAAQTNGQIVNFSKIADDVGVDIKTVQSYFSILEDTLAGFLLPAYHRSVRKSQRSHPKFYFFDTGVKRSLEGTLRQDILPRTYAFGRAFEHFLILEIFRLNDYYRGDCRLSFLRTKDGLEIDLVLDRPGRPTAFIEIKSSDCVTERDLSSLNRFLNDTLAGEGFCLSLDLHEKKIGHVSCFPWTQGLKALGFSPR